MYQHLVITWIWKGEREDKENSQVDGEALLTRQRKEITGQIWAKSYEIVLDILSLRCI